MMRVVWTLVLVGLLAIAGDASRGTQSEQAQPQQRQPQQQEEFVPIDQLPPEEQLPAAPMVVAAYAFIWIAFLAYVFTLVRRVKRVESDLRRLEQGPR